MPTAIHRYDVAMGRFFKEYSEFLAELFPAKMQKLTIDAGFSCPNRDGTLGRGGCVYCNNASFSPDLGAEAITLQLNRGKAFFARKYPDMRYLAYFQSYTNTHAPIDRLMALYREALSVTGVEGLIIGTRPDCMPNSLLQSLAALERPVILEFGAESCHNNTLKLINRCHSWQQTVDAVVRAHSAGFPVGLHFIMGLPGESEEMMLQSVAEAAALPLASIKFHQMQIIKGTTLARESTGLFCCSDTDKKNQPAFRGAPIKIFEIDEYINLCVRIVDYLRSVSPNIAIDRFTSQAPADLLIAPRWGLKNYQFTNLLVNALSKHFNV